MQNGDISIGFSRQRTRAPVLNPRRNRDTVNFATMSQSALQGRRRQRLQDLLARQPETEQPRVLSGERLELQANG